MNREPLVSERNSLATKLRALCEMKNGYMLTEKSKKQLTKSDVACMSLLVAYTGLLEILWIVEDEEELKNRRLKNLLKLTSSKFLKTLNASFTYCTATFQISRINPNIYKTKTKLKHHKNHYSCLKEGLKVRLNYCKLKEKQYEEKSPWHDGERH